MSLISSLLTNSIQPVDELSIVVNGQAIIGWQEIMVSRSLRQFPSSFAVGFTERNPTSATSVIAVPGDPCTVMIGGDTVLTGYVDRYVAEISPGSHNIQIVGRSKCEDLFDCGTEKPGLAAGASALSYAKQLAEPFGIKVTQPGKGNGRTYPFLAGNMTESPYRLIEVVARYSALLVYDDVNGDLVLNDVEAGKMASGFYEGHNIQSATVEFAMDRRFSEYHVVVNPVADFLGMTGATNQVGFAKDERVLRHRPLYLTSPQLVESFDIANERALWEKNRRYGEAYAVRLTCDSWRDTAGKLWQPNYTAPINIPSVKINNPTDWVIVDVSYRRNLQQGTVAELTMMPSLALSLQPQSPVGTFPGIAIQQGNR